MIHASEKDHISKGDVQRVRDLYRCNDCPQVGGSGGGLTLFSYAEKSKPEKPKNKELVFKDEPWSINFHGLSDLDSKRGPEGCIKFMYQFEGVQERSLALELLRMGLKTTFDDRSVDAISIWSGINFGSANWSRAVVPIDVSTPFVLQFKFKLLEESNRGSVKVDNLEVRYTACDHPSHATSFGLKVTQLKSLSIKSMKSFKYMMPPSLGSFRSSVVGSSSSNLSKNPSSKAGWLRSLPSRVFKSKKSQSLGSSRYSFGSFSSKRSGVSTPDIPKLSIEK
nr:PREDICTED: uncharacterized protein LOC109035275 [Bemisia tabaci]